METFDSMTELAHSSAASSNAAAFASYCGLLPPVIMLANDCFCFGNVSIGCVECVVG